MSSAANGGGNGRRTSPMALLEDPETIRARRESERMLPPPAPHLPAMVREAARPERRPTDQEWEKMDDALNKMFQALPGEAEAAAARDATKLVVDAFGIDLSHVREIIFDPDLGQPAQTDASTGEIRLSATAFQDGPGALAATLLHEVTHANQGHIRGDFNEPHPNVLAYEVMAYQTAETHAKELRLEQAFLDDNREKQEKALEGLHSDNRDRLLQTGEYWEMDPNKPGDPKAFEEMGVQSSWTTDPEKLTLLLRGGRT